MKFVLALIQLLANLAGMILVGSGYGSGIAKSPMSQNDSYSTQSKYNIIKTTSDHQ